ncbi:type IV pilin protein [Aliivibrio sp. S3MY1]|uniref:type IV pilin protein n=1 Tax=unclassified Aliivibrio TaxID=2645654 RepID=UPI002378D0FD|nr:MULTISPECIES: type IV pilin protein [unclassified Aliivibrio]MDD9195976.1 type IV pilin protein [Aliivibrio sp. S3MY1]MDD9199357.1 type IV pilin protein [Aliivibrio sp. S2MY1]
MIRIFSLSKALKFHNGVTLVELLIVVAIMSILASVAYPNYMVHVLKSHRMEAVSALIKTQLHIESLYSTRAETAAKDRYKALLELVINKEIGSCLIDSVCGIDNKRYHLSYDLLGSGSNTYILSATPQSALGQNKDSCGILSLNAAGVGSGEDTHCW